MTAKDATILSIIADLPQTQYFETLLARLDDPTLRVRAERLKTRDLQRTA
jgi:hypothetical protein